MIHLRGEVRGLPLSDRELDAFEALARHGHHKDAAAAMGVRPQTVRNYLRRGYAKLGVETAIEAFVALGWLQVPIEGERQYQRMRTKLIELRDEVTALLGRFRLTGSPARAGTAVPS